MLNPRSHKLLRKVRWVCPRGGQGSASSLYAVAANTNLFNQVSIIAAVIGVVSFFLPVCRIGGSVMGASFDISASCFQLVTGQTISLLGQSQSVPGDISNLLYVIPFVVALVLAFVAKGKGRWIGQIVCGAISFALMIFFYNYIRSNAGVSYSGSYGSFSVSMAIAFYLMIIASIALIAFGVLSLKKANK